MAITKLSSKSFVSSEESGQTSSDHMKVSPGGSIPMHVPSIMAYIASGAPSYQSTLTQGNLIFANDVSCMPQSESVVQTQNFISPKLENNNTFDNIVSEDDPIVKRGTKLKCKFTNGSLTGIKFTTS